MSDISPPTTNAAPLELPSGAILQAGRFVVQRTLGRGGFGITYAADDRRLGRPVALKELFCDGAIRHRGVVTPPPHGAEAFAAAKARFLREAAVLARFTHPGIVHVYEVFEEAGTAYLVMELLEGRTLYDHVLARGGPLVESDALDVAHRCGTALVAVHAAGILHRDLNPANVMLTGEGRVVLIDFGLAREYSVDETTPMTRMVTPGYAPPEQYALDARCGPPADVYGLAATLYWTLTSRAPAPAIDRQTGAPLAPPYRIIQSVSKPLSDGVLDGLELNPGHRPQTVEAFLARIGRPSPNGTSAPAAAIPDRDATRVEGTLPLASPPAPLPVPPSVEPGRRTALLPLFAIALAFGALVPILSVVVAAVVVLPALCTAGDAVVYTRLRRSGDRLLWRHRTALLGYVPVRFIRNLGHVLVAGVPALLLLGATVATALAIDSVTSTSTAADWVLRIGGAGAMAALVLLVVRDRMQFRAALILDRLVRSAVDDGRLTVVGQGLWIVAGVFLIGAIGLHPEPWPF
ncbi:MAG TPA: serine/threonine-protein kinase [Acidimicrobiales bacterium]|nr:serine/threonine-protein kinase [Acidimicrobiales bacterium]